MFDKLAVWYKLISPLTLKVQKDTDFPGSSVVKTVLPRQGAQVLFLVRENPMDGRAL